MRVFVIYSRISSLLFVVFTFDIFAKIKHLPTRDQADARDEDLTCQDRRGFEETTIKIG